MPALPALTGARAAHSDRGRRESLLARLYAEQLALTPEVAYLRSHARPKVIAGQVAVFDWYRRLLPASGRVLDWGCNHAPDSCLVREWAGDRFELHGCDFQEPNGYAAFHHFAG